MIKKIAALLKKTTPTNYSILDQNELKRLRGLPRYTPTDSKIFGVDIKINDACTLIGDVRGILQSGVYEFKSDLDKPIIIDCGSNVGISIIYFKQLYPEATVFGFEPDPGLFRNLRFNVDSFGFRDVTLSQSAIWVDDKGITFKREGGHSGAIYEGGYSGDDVVKVSTTHLADMLASMDNISMLKMDIEGAENEVIFDCSDQLSKCDHIFIEYHSRADKPQKLHDILRLLSGKGFRYHIHDAYTRKKPFIDNDCMVGMDLQLNLFFKKQ